MKTLILLILSLSFVSFIHTEDTLLKSMVNFITQHKYPTILSGKLKEYHFLDKSISLVREVNKAEIYKLEKVGVPKEIVEYFEEYIDFHNYNDVTTYEQFSYKDKKVKMTKGFAGIQAGSDDDTVKIAYFEVQLEGTVEGAKKKNYVPCDKIKPNLRMLQMQRMCYQEVEFEINQADIQKFKLYSESLCRKEIANTIKEIMSIVKASSFMIIN